MKGTFCESDKLFTASAPSRRRGILALFALIENSHVDHKPSLLKRAFQFLLSCLSGVYQGALHVRHFLYDRGWIKSTTSELVTVNVGSVTAGGSGKTPFVLKLMDDLAQSGYLAVVTRGYRGKNEHRKPKLMKAGASWEEMGDEAYMIAVRHPEAKIYVGKRRELSVELAKQDDANLAILDDGFQYRKFTASHHVALISARHDLRHEAFLPRGKLRDLPERLSIADMVIVTHANTGESKKKAKEAVQYFSKAPIAFAKHQFSGISWLSSKGPSQGRVAAFCGIAFPDSFFQTIEEAGYQIIHSAILLDHEKFAEKDLQSFVRVAITAGAKAIICSEKDLVKLQDVKIELPLGCVKIELAIEEGEEGYRSWIRSIKDEITNRRKDTE